MKKGNFGETLRREREMRGVSLEEIANATRISTRFLLALENEQWHELPGGVFNRGFVRSVSRFLGLDEDALMSEYSLTTNDKPEMAVWATDGKGQRRIMPALTLALMAALLAGGYLAWRESAAWLGPWISDLWDRAALAQRSSSAAAEAATATQDAAAIAPAAAPAAPAIDASAELVLKVEAGKPTAVTVIADGAVVFEGSMDKDHKQSFHARERFEVSARDPSAIFVTLNGREIPPLGPPGQPGSKTLTRADLTPQEGRSN